jgi:hypothetical protein
MDRNELETYKVELLQGSANYRTWKFSMKMVLQAKDLWEIVSGEEEKPSQSTDAVDWERRARKALATIVLSLAAEEKEHIIDCSTPKEAWNVLEKLYEGKGRNRKFMLLQDLFGMNMDASGSMDLYLRSVKEKMSELAVIGLKLEDDVKLAIILNGLPEEYRYLAVTFENVEKIDFDELSARLQEEEKKIGPHNGKAALKARVKSPGKLRLKCWQCGEMGHVQADCPEDKSKKAEAKFAM